MSDPSAPQKGLEHVVMGESSIALVAGETGGLAYRGFDIGELVGRASYEAVVHLLVSGDPPSSTELRAIEQELRDRRSLSPDLATAVDALPRDLGPLEALRTLVSAMGRPAFDYPPTRGQGLDLIAKAPTLLARYVRRSAGQSPVPPSTDLGQVANYLYMLHGTVPTPHQVEALESYFVMLADHGMNASTFALRVVLSTNADLISGATAGLAALKGPLHGGAPSKVSDMLDAIGHAESASAWIDGALARRERLMGFGHRAYKTEDPRAVLLHRVAQSVADPARLALAEAVEQTAVAALQRARPGRRLYANVEFYGAIVLEASGLDRSLFTPTFALARTAGWTAHALEQVADNRLIRPDVRYIGPLPGRTWPGPGS